MDSIKIDIMILAPIMFALWLLSRPRKPKAVFAHFNRMVRYIVFGIVASTLLIIETWMVLAFDLKVIPDAGFIQNIFPFLIIGYVTLMGIYVLYWSQPFSRKRTGVKAVDEALERYKKPKENIVDMWVPALVLNGERYHNAYYIGGRREWIIVNEQGKVLHDEKTAHTLRNMLRIALQIAHPEHINYRTNAYTSSQNGTKTMRTLLAQFETIMEPVRRAGGKRDEDEIEAVKRAAEVGVRFQEGMCAYWLAEGEWGNKHGGTKLKELTYEDWRKLIERLHKETLWLRDEIDTLKTGAAKAEAIRKRLKKQGMSEQLNGLLTAVIGQNAELTEPYAGLEAGCVIGYERGMDAEELSAWHSRLAWVKEVDGKGELK